MKLVQFGFLYLLLVLIPTKSDDGIYWKDVEVPQGITLYFTPGKPLEYGETVMPSQTENTPEASWEVNDNTYYTIAIINPDIVKRNQPETKQFIHWLVVNILGKDLSSGNTLVPFMGPHPFKNTGAHRYTVFLFEQKENLDFEKLGTNFKERSNFNIRKFAENNSLGSPAAATYFKAQWEPYVEEVLKKHLELR